MTLNEILQGIGDKIIKDAKSILQSKNKIASGTLYNSLKATATDDQLQFSMADYGKYVDRGRKPGTFVPIKPLKEWCKLKGLDSSVAYAISWAIKRRGIKATYFFSMPYEDYTDDLDKTIDAYINNMLDTLDASSSEAELYGF